MRLSMLFSLLSKCIRSISTGTRPPREGFLPRPTPAGGVSASLNPHGGSASPDTRGRAPPRPTPIENWCRCFTWRRLHWSIVFAPLHGSRWDRNGSKLDLLALAPLSRKLAVLNTLTCMGFGFKKISLLNLYLFVALARAPY